MNAPVRLIDTPERVKLSVDDFLLLDEHGAFADYKKTELIGGEIWGMNAQHLPHARVKSRLHRLIGNRLELIGSDLEAVVEVTVRVADDSAPEPDIVLTRWKGNGVVPVDTVALVIEVSDTTLATDLGRKADLYAAAGIPEYWVVDLNENRVLVHELPQDGNYMGQGDMLIGGPLSSSTMKGLEIDTATLLT